MVTVAQGDRHLSPKLACALIAAAFLVTMAGTTMPTPLYQGYQEKMGFSVLTVTVIYAVYAGGVLASLLIAGRWSDSIGRRPMLIAGLAIAAASDGVFLLADHVNGLVVGRLLSGVSAGLYVGTGTAAVIEAAPAHWKDNAPLLATAANIGGLGLGPLLAAGLVDTLPWPLHLPYAVHIALVLPLILLLRRVPETVAVVPGARVRLAPPARVPASVRALFIAAAVSSFAGFAVLGLLTALSPRLIGLVVAQPDHVQQVSVVVTMFGASVIAQALTRRMPTDRAVLIGTGTLVLGCLLLALAIRLNLLSLLVAAAIVAGAGQGVAFSRGLGAVVSRTEPPARAGVASAFFVVAYVALSFPVIGAGFGVRAWGLALTAELFSVGVALLALAALALLWIEQRRTAGPAA